MKAQEPEIGSIAVSLKFIQNHLMESDKVLLIKGHNFRDLFSNNSTKSQGEIRLRVDSVDTGHVRG